MRVLNDFECPEGHRFERFIDSESKETRCDCGLMATKVLSAPRVYLDPISGDFPGATMKWARQRQEQIKAERKSSDA